MMAKNPGPTRTSFHQDPSRRRIAELKRESAELAEEVFQLRTPANSLDRGSQSDHLQCSRSRDVQREDQSTVSASRKVLSESMLTGPDEREDTPDVRSFLGMTAVISSDRMRSIMQFVERIAQSNAAVLVTGESGTGKELIARALHQHSSRNGKPWIDINCAALPDH